VYYLDREDPKIVKPIHVRTIELADRKYHIDAHSEIMHFHVCGNFLAIPKHWSRVKDSRSYEVFGVEFYDMERSRKGEPDLIYNIDNLSALGWWNEPIPYTNINYYDLEDSESKPLTKMDYDNARDFFSENIFVCSRDNGDGNFSVEIHEISSDRCSMIKKVGLHTDPSYRFDNLYVESLGNSTWNFFMTSVRSLETHILHYDKKNNELTTRIEEEPYRTINTRSKNALRNAHARVVSKLKAEGKVFGHVRFSQELGPESGYSGLFHWKAYLNFYA